MKHIHRLVSLLLVLALCVGMVPCVFAAESPATEPSMEETTPTEETTQPPSEMEEVAVPEDIPGDDPPESIADTDDIAAYASTQKSILLFDYTDNGDYTTRLNSQINISYKWNGTGSTLSCYLKNMGWHFARYNNTPYADDPLYCIEPHKSYAASTSGNSVDRDVTLDGSSSTTGGNIWYSLNANRREAIGLILLYSNQMWDHSISVSTTKKDDNPNVPLRIATQFLIFEIVTGLRDADTFQLKSSNECGTSGDIYYNAGVASVSGFAPKYNTLVSYVEAAMQIPSFTSASSSTAPTIELTGDTTSVYDSNSVLSGFSFTNGNGAKFTKSGNTLTITQTGTISESTVFKATKSIPSAENSTYSIWYMSGSKYQTTINLYDPSTGNLTAYFKLKAPALGNLSLTKTTEDGENLSGWKFGIYSNSACTNLVSGPHTTNSSGKISVTGLTAGTYYVKELGHTDSSINALYTCASTNPQKVTITSGGTASVSFHNKLNTGSVAIQKQTNTGENLGGWKIGLYMDSGCTNAVSGSPFTTANDGTILVNGLQPGTYYAKELPTDDPYWGIETEVKKVTVTANQTAAVNFSNTHYGRIQIQKTTNTGNHLSGWVFRVKDASGNLVCELTTDETGYAITGNLPLGRYYIAEVPTEDPYWVGELGFHDVTVKAGETVTDTWNNRETGLGWCYKKTNTGENVEGWHITIYSDPDCTQEVGKIVTNEEGRGGCYLDPGTYYAKETGDEYGRFQDEYWMVDESVQKLEITAHAETAVTFTNVQYGKLKIVKTVEGDGSLSGWVFKVTDADGTEISGSPFTTSENGTILETILPGTYTVEEILPEDSPYECKSVNPQTVTVIQGQTAEVSFVNTIRTGKITIHKVDTQGAPLAGATFLLEWSEDGSLWWPVTYSEAVKKGCTTNANVADGCLTSGEDGLLAWTGLYPGLQYRLTETKAPEGFKLLSGTAFEGELHQEDLTVELTVVNAHTFTMPKTGSASGAALKVLSLLSAIACLGVLIYQKKRR